jgi:REP element-mobilizing transposase RayT
MTDSSPFTDTFYRRQLPHWQPAGATIFLTWRLYGSLPKVALYWLKEERHRLEKQPVRPDETPRDRALRHSKSLFALADKMLAENMANPHWLKEEQIAQLVVDALFYHEGKLYTLLAFVVMPNHVHVLLQPLEEKREGQIEQSGQATKSNSDGDTPGYVPLRRITQSPKGYTAREANRLLGRTGQAFWQDESYDHWVRDEGELERIVTYIEWDPVKSGLVTKPDEWHWSSAWEREYGRWSKP